jgi:cellulose synthase operon protein C
MSDRPPAALPMPWLDRGEAPKTDVPSPRSQRDLEILRALAGRIDPNDAGAHNNLGVVYYNKGLFDEAVEQFELALEIDPRMQVAERNLQIVYFGAGYFERTITLLRTRLEQDPSDERARDALARAYFNGGSLSEAVRELRELRTLRPDDASVHQRLARAELKRGNLDAAITALRDAERLDADNGRTCFMIGEVLYHQGRSVEARDALERAVSLDDSLFDAYHLLAFVYGDLGSDERAQRAAELASKLNPSYAKAEAGLSLDSYSTARYEELIGARRGDAPEVAEGGELAHYNLGLAFRQKALYDEALREFRLATERGENTFLVQQAQAELLLLRGDAEALALYGELLEQESSSPKLWNELGVAHHQAGELMEAEEAYRRSLEIDPGYALAWNNLAVVRHHLGRPSAEEAFRAAIEQGRAVSDVWRNYALLLHRDGRLQDSTLAYEQSLDEDGSSAHTRTGYGILLMDLGRPHDARMQLLRAVETEPRLPDARYQLAFALSALGDYQGALREAKLAMELSPYIPSPRFRLLIDLHFEEASVLAPELDTAEYRAGADGIDRFQFHPEALDDVFGHGATGAVGSEQGGPSAPGAELLRAAHTALERGLLDEATTAAQRAAIQGASRTEVLLLQGEIFLRRGASGEAVERFNEALAEIAGGDDDSDDALRRALSGAARSLMDLGRMQEAVEAAERLCGLAGEEVESLRILGDALARVADYGRAAIVLEHARLGAPNDVGLLTQLGSAYAAAGDPEGAELALQRAIAHDPHAVGARVALADVLVEEGRIDEAEFQYRESLRRLPSYGDAAFGLASLEESRGRVDEAVNVLVDLLSTDPYRLDALLRLGRLLLETQRQKQARFAFERVLRFDPKNEAAQAALADLASARS